MSIHSDTLTRFVIYYADQGVVIYDTLNNRNSAIAKEAVSYESIKSIIDHMKAHND